MIMNEKNLKEQMEKALEEKLKELKKEYTKILKLNNYKYNEECIQISSDKKSIFVSSLRDYKEVLIKFSKQNVYIMMDDKSGIFNVKDLKIKKKEINLTSETEYTNLKIFKENDFTIELNKDSEVNFDRVILNFKNKLSEVIYFFINYNLYSEISDRQSEINF